VLDDRDLDIALGKISPVAMEDRGVRFVRRKYMNEPLSVKGSLLAGGRYNIPKHLLEEMGLPFTGALYIGRNIKIAMAETGADSEQSTKAIFRIMYKLDAVLDLTSKDNLRLLGTSYQELTGNWRETNDEECEISPTQRLGLGMKRSNRFSAIKCPSAKTQKGNNYNLVIFIDEANEMHEIEQEGIYIKAEIIE
jgi:RES domain-containing protein